MKIVDLKWLNRRAKAIETQKLKKYHKSLTWISILNHFNPCIITVGENYLEIDEDKYKEIRTQMLKGE